MNKVKSEIKANLERVPFFLVCISALCFLISYTDLYFYGFEMIQNIFDYSIVFCIFMYGCSEKWGFIAKKSIYTLLALNILNILSECYLVENYYFYYVGLIYAFFVTLLIYSKCKNT